MSEPVCLRLGKWIGGCKFEPRYDLSAAKPVKMREADAVTALEVLDRHRDSTYVRDICVTCGRTVEREIFIEGLGPAEASDEA